MERSTTSVRELKARLSAYLHRVETGETVIITRHGKPIGRIVPLETSTEARLEMLEQAGLIAWNGARLAMLSPVTQTHGRSTVAELLVEDRV